MSDSIVWLSLTSLEASVLASLAERVHDDINEHGGEGLGWNAAKTAAYRRVVTKIQTARLKAYEEAQR